MSINRKDYDGFKWNQVFEACGVLIGDWIDIELDIHAIKRAS